MKFESNCILSFLLKLACIRLTCFVISLSINYSYNDYILFLDILFNWVEYIFLFFLFFSWQYSFFEFSILSKRRWCGQYNFKLRLEPAGLCKQDEIIQWPFSSNKQALRNPWWDFLIFPARVNTACLWGQGKRRAFQFQQHGARNGLPPHFLWLGRIPLSYCS